MAAQDPRDSTCRCTGGCGLSRRDFVKLVGQGAAAAALAGVRPVMAGPFEAADFEKLIPADKKLSPDWVKSLFARGVPTVYRGAELGRIGMPVGGICTGQVYLGGDGRLWLWDIFNVPRTTADANYAKPLEPWSPLDQGFAIRVTSGGQKTGRRLDRTGFRDIGFRGEYPIGFVEYRDPALPVTVDLEAFSPFIPLDAANSSLPVVILRFTVKNTSKAKVDCLLAGWLENAVCVSSGMAGLGLRRNRLLRRPGCAVIECSAEAAPPQPERPPIVLEGFEGKDYGNWKVEGEAFGKAPAKGAPNPVQRLSGFEGQSLANSWPGSDEPRGRLISPPLTVERPFISFLIGGGDHPGETCINLVVDEKVVRTQTGRNTDAMTCVNWGVHDLLGKTARIEIVDNHTGGWGHIDIDQIELRDRPRGALPIEDSADFGTMALALLDFRDGDIANVSIRDGGPERGAILNIAELTGRDEKPFGQTLRGACARPIVLDPGQRGDVTFAITWHFPNLRLDGMEGIVGRRYAKRFRSAAAVAEHVAQNIASLREATRLWHDTWYDSTLPHWFLDRTFANTSTLATSTAHWFRNGRFYGWEGVGCCAGTCTHVWHYAHAVGRLFPELERSAREMADYGISFDPNTGAIDFRGEYRNGIAVDGQAGCILRALREHQMSADDAFLERNWPKIRKSLEYLIGQDGDGDGILEGSQHNTLDAAWYGPVAWLSSLYLAALRAGEEMAREIGDEAFARRARAIFDRGRKKIVEMLWNGEYFVHKPDAKHPEAIGSAGGCEIDQVFGQSWAFQVGLGRVIDEEHSRKALQSLWRYNFTPDVGPYREANKSGRWYAMAGEGGLLMCTWPRGGRIKASGQVNAWADGYFNECMSGFEHQVAGHMIWEGLVTEGLAIVRAIHDRYHASRRNPWNEVECGDHYARAMASYGVFLAACGYEHHGPKGYLAFAPRLSPEAFRAAFTTAEGWGTFRQKREAPVQRDGITVKWGRLRLRTLAFGVGPNTKAGRVTVTVAGKPIAVDHDLADGQVRIRFADEVVVQAGQAVDVEIG